MKNLMLILLLLLTVTAPAQKRVIQKDSLPAKVILKENVQLRKPVSIISVEATIESGLNKIVAVYTNQPNTVATWLKIKAAADDFLYAYFRDGKLQGTKKDQAYFINIGPETMSQADISNHKMILMAGVATVKPAEFVLIRVEQICTK